MLYGNQLEKELIYKGLLDTGRKKKKKTRKKFNCVKCGSPMLRIEDTNVMVCSECKNYFIFSK